MTREIKFRSWDPLKKEMMQAGSLNDWFGAISKLRINPIKANPHEIFMQFTSLKDKNGVEIYEGDILRYDGEERIVVYEAPSFELQLKETRAFAWDNWAEFGEIIGNIYQNPELLK